MSEMQTFRTATGSSSELSRTAEFRGHVGCSEVWILLSPPVSPFDGTIFGRLYVAYWQTRAA